MGIIMGSQVTEELSASLTDVRILRTIPEYIEEEALALLNYEPSWLVHI
jgi:hypothetical protein